MIRTTAFLLLAGLQASSLAESLNVTTPGRGRAERSSAGSLDIQRVTLQLYNDQRFRLFFNGESVPRSLSGTYRNAGNRTYSVNVDSAFERSDSMGHGVITLGSGSRVDKIEIKGQQATNATGSSSRRPFSVSFMSSALREEEEAARRRQEEERNRQATDDRDRMDDWDDQGRPRRDDDRRGNDRRDDRWDDRISSGVAGLSRGTGALSYKSDRDRLDSLQVTKGNSRRVNLLFEGEARVRLEGDLNGSRFTIRRINGRAASGSGTITNLMSPRVKVNANGRYQGSRLTVTYQGADRGGPRRDRGNERPGRPQRPDRADALTHNFGPSTVQGSGTMSYKGDRDTLDRAILDFNSDHTFRLSFEGEAKVALEGRYSVRNRTYTLTITRVNGKSASGSGTLTRFASGELARVSVDSRYEGSRLTLNFRRDD